MSTLDNLIHITFSTAEINTINNAFNAIRSVIDGKVINLTPEERQLYGNIGNNTENWINKVANYMDQEPNLIPFFLNKANFDADMKARNQIKPMLKQLSFMNETLSDTAMLLSTDIYNAAIAYYRNIKMASVQNVPGSTGIYQDLADQFPGRSSAVPELPEQPRQENASEDELNTPPDNAE